MKILFTTLILLINIQIYASTHHEILSLKKAADVGTNGGDASIINKMFHQSDYKKLVPELLNDIKESDCSFTPVIGKAQLKNHVDSFQFFSASKKSVQLILKMIENKKIIGAIGYFWDGTNGESEYCSTEKLDLYFENGESLILTFDSTT